MTRTVLIILLATLLAACGGGEGEEQAEPHSGSPAPAASPSLAETRAGEGATSTAGGDFSRVVFLHHSVGASLIEDGAVRELLTDLGYEFYDHGYNDDGLVLADGTWSGLNFDVPDDNTDPDGLAGIFAQPLHDPPDNTFSYLMQYDVIGFKSCYPVSEIESDEQLAEYKSYYLSIRDRIDQYPNRVFIVVTPPPQVAAYIEPEAAARARAFADWLASDEYLSGHPNVFTFDLFDLLADPSTNTLREDYQADEDDAHPNELANQTIGPFFVDFIDQAVRTYAAEEVPEEAVSTPSEPPVGSPVPTVALRAPSSSLCSDAEPQFVTDFEVRQTPSLDEPPARVPFRDPVFGTCLVRVTDRTTDTSADDTSAGLKNEYSRVQSFNADGTRLLVRGIEATWYLYDAHTFRPLGQLPFGGSVDPRWDAADPDVIYYSDETRLMSYNVRSGEQTLVHEFADDFPGQNLAAVWGRYEGSPSRDGRYWGLMAQDEDWETVAFLVYDRQIDEVIAKRDAPRGDPDSVTISPLGDYFLAYYEHCEEGQLGDDAHPCGLMVYDRDLTNGRSLLRIVGHSDLALDAEGREVAIFQDIDEDNISMLDLATGTVTALWPIDFSNTAIGLHFSGRSFARSGWALVSTHDGDPGAYTWMDDQVFAVELKAGGRVLRLAHTHSLVDEEQEHDYWAEPHASVNRDFTRIVFTTNWGRSGTGEVEMFLIELPPDWPERLP